MKPYESWFEKAQNDLNTARELLSDSHPALDMVIQYTLEAAQKSIKAFLKCRGESLDGASNLNELVELCVEIDPALAILADPAEELSAYGIIFRDPEEAEITPEKNEAAEAVQLAEEIVMRVKDRINL